MEMLIILALAFGAMYLMTSRTRKQQRQAADFRANLEVGQEVMTGSGLYGTIVDIDGDTITLESTPGNHTRWIRAAIAQQVPPVADDLDDDDAEADDPERDDAEWDDEAFGDDHDSASDPRSPAGRGSDDLTHDSIDVPDDLSTLDERRTDDGTDRR